MDRTGRLADWTPPASWAGQFWAVGWTFDDNLFYRGTRDLFADWTGVITPLARYSDAVRQELRDGSWSDSDRWDEMETGESALILLPGAVCLAAIEMDSGTVFDASLEGAVEWRNVPVR
ncbi:hypothetical protein OIE66_06555 [Nonomuraea sp. NBC_01738]|uniref:hypothetical protein n=1 Tax=Nonomuraea sp. NBC_01738 TaxID=2976003 RepID=UPI002E12BD62|nr:hypothetical protein OIE66_06555 [Nonomuraea sp. NBC_01738]